MEVRKAGATMEMNQEVQQRLEAHVSPRLIAANHILELSSQELQETISEEIDENPALEMLDVAVCHVCGRPLENGKCVRCSRRDDSSVAAVDSSETYLETLSIGGTAREDDYDPMAVVAMQITLAEKLLTDMRAILDLELMPIAEYLVGSLDGDGYLRCSTYEVAAQLDVDAEIVEDVIRHLQSLDPPGVGARDIQECMILQLEHLASLGVENSLALPLVRDHLEELGRHKFSRIAQKLGVGEGDVEAAWAFIKASLNPHPAENVNRDQGGWAPRPAQGYVIPDVIITAGEKGLDVEIVESRRFALSINPMYQQLIAQLNSSEHSDVDREHIHHYVSRARMFIANINQRRQTMMKITGFLVDYQRDFLLNGVRHLKPLTRATLAEQTGIHESTVSRATAGKFVMVPNGRVIPFSNFFSSSLGVKDIIREMISAEETPLTDQEIARQLKERGHAIARRTVAKYRDQLDILPSSLR